MPSVLKKFLLCSILRERLESFLFWQFQYLFHQLLWCPSSRHGMGSRKLLPTISQSANKWPTCSSLSLSLFPCHFCWFLESRFNLTKNYDALRNLWSIEQPGCHRKRKTPGQRKSQSHGTSSKFPVRVNILAGCEDIYGASSPCVIDVRAQVLYAKVLAKW